jgi:hypothetical protein
MDVDAPGNLPLRARIPVRELLVDLLGGLLPGTLYVLGLIPGFLVPAVFFVAVVEGKAPSPLRDWNVPDSAVFWLAAFLLILMTAYVVGHLFFRESPKTPDERSVLRTNAHLEEGAAVRLAENPDSTGPTSVLERFRRWWSPPKPDVEFPYLFIREYLVHRGLSHLADLVPWDGGDRSSHARRSKHFINLLKIRLEFSFPERMGRLVRNEAHVRLSSSTWYVGRALQTAAIAGIVLAAGANGLAWYRASDVMHVPQIEILAMPILTLTIARMARRKVERVLYYQRVREVVFILETAFWADKLLEELNVLEELD